jgi:cyanuric acid amidohydrolase
VGGVIAAATGRTDLFVSGGAEHQGPDGGGPVAVIARQR